MKLNTSQAETSFIDLAAVYTPSKRRTFSSIIFLFLTITLSMDTGPSKALHIITSLSTPYTVLNPLVYPSLWETFLSTMFMNLNFNSACDVAKSQISGSRSKLCALYFTHVDNFSSITSLTQYIWNNLLLLTNQNHLDANKSVCYPTSKSEIETRIKYHTVLKKVFP